MTNIRVSVYNGFVHKIEVKGHTGYAEEGKDIICAALSAVMCNCHLGLEKVLNLDFKTVMDDYTGYMLIQMNDSNYQNQQAQTLLQTTALTLREIAEGFSKYVSIRFIE